MDVQNYFLSSDLSEYNLFIQMTTLNYLKLVVVGIDLLIFFQPAL